MADLPSYVEEDGHLAEETKLFTTNFEITGVGTTELPLFLFRNPSGSGKVARLKRLTLSNTHTVTSFIRFRLYVAPTITTNGTAVTPASTKLGSGVASVVLTNTSPTLSNNGTRAATYAVAAFSNALIIPFEYDVLIPENVTVALTGQADGASRVAAGSLIWSEV